MYPLGQILTLIALSSHSYSDLLRVIALLSTITEKMHIKPWFHLGHFLIDSSDSHEKLTLNETIDRRGYYSDGSIGA